MPAGSGAGTPGTFAPGAELRCTLRATDPDGGSVAVTWDVRKDVADNPNVGGDREAPAEPIAGCVVSWHGSEAVIRLPTVVGPYRIFAYARNAHGGAATANVPVMIR